jgi:hypothetical protein
MKMAVFWVAPQCSLVEVYRHFGSAYRLHHQGDRGRDLNPEYPEYEAGVSNTRPRLCCLAREIGT